jgi:hypothetical protein
LEDISPGNGEEREMLQRFFVILMGIIIVNGCTTTQQTPTFQFATGTRVGIINHLEPYATHQNYQPVRVGNFTKKVDVDWNMPDYVQDQVKRVLKSDSRYTVISLKLDEPFSASTQFAGPLTEPSVSNEKTAPGIIKPELANHLDALAKKNDLNVIIWIRSFKGPSPFKISDHPIPLGGYGLFTRQLMLSKRAFAYAQIEVVVIKTPPATYIGSGTPKTSTSSLNDFELPDDLKNISPSEFNKLRPLIQNYADEAVNKALQDANLIAPK